MDTKVLKIQSFSIVLVAVNQSASILNPDFLKYNQIVPMEWNLGMPPISTPSLSQVVFNNGFNIIAQGDRITFLQSFEPNTSFSADVAEVASKYIDAIPYLNYQAIGINFTEYVVLETVETANDFILNKIITSGTWKFFQGVPPQSAVIQLFYPLIDTTLAVTIQEGGMESSSNDNKITPILLFSANFHRDITNTNEGQGLEVKKIIQSWEKDLSTFNSLVENNFLGR